ncbi:arginyltransferase [Larsenimonas suaedae]|uniref:Aspartate/glutamate leucyltransferase n=1 Tax=Larsenimonas suaedae TaxID=1851019 RepID=A0ABU1GYK2_9GAMM|nr:arginyltransferase [Larsenimonas suaedae]MCM2972821.1 arginyltransferase [Larsenimonas suaedae]MDR5896920.1 arginyltransferase [Larsenimonas suaedae]
MTDSTRTLKPQDLRFFLTAPHNCSYVAEQEATTLFMDPEHAINKEVYSALTLMGFRRSGQHLYRPHCASCQGCVSVRVPVDEFSPNRTQRKIIGRNKDLTVQFREAKFTNEHYALYNQYIREKHFNGDMFPPSVEQYCSFLAREHTFSAFIEFRDQGVLVAVAAMDCLSHGLSAIYTFYTPDPAYAARSLGTYAILWQIHEAQRQGLPYVYLGYWIEQSRKMAYKKKFTPLEYLDGGRWRKLLET